jgi:O-antigen/teichoic acid export membrane protein
MINSTSIKSRFAISLMGNFSTSALNFASTIVLARLLGPDGFGTFSFLITSFIAIRILYDPGVTNAYFTFVSKRAQNKNLHFIVLFWLIITTVTISGLISALPAKTINFIWVSQPKNLIILAFIATLLRNVVWQMVGQLGESGRKTFWVQISNTISAGIYISLIILLWSLHKLNITNVLLITAVEFFVMSLVTIRFLYSKGAFAFSTEEMSLRAGFDKFKIYCKPLVVLAIFSFFYDFLDRWFLQKFAGSVEQGFFQIALQFSIISLLTTRSILNILWKEIADCGDNNERIGYLFNRTAKILFFVSATILAMLIPWSKEITLLFLGTQYSNAWPVLAIMLAYPTYQAYAYISSTVFNACENTKTYTKITVFLTIFGTLAAYLILAPKTAFVPGLGMGAMGLAIKIVLVSIVGVNLQVFVLSRIHSFKFDWLHQLISIALLISIGLLLKLPFNFMEISSKPKLLASICVFSLIFLMIVATVVLKSPYLIGSSREEIKGIFSKAKFTFLSLFRK